MRTAPSTHWRSCIDVMQLHSCASVAGSLVCHIGVGLRARFLSRPFSLATCPQPCSKCRTKCCRQAGEQWVTSSCRLREALSMSVTLLNILNCSCAAAVKCEDPHCKRGGQHPLGAGGIQMSGARVQLRTPPPGPEPWYAPCTVYIGEWRCKLCNGTYATPDHVQTTKHRHREANWWQYLEVEDHAAVDAFFNQQPRLLDVPAVPAVPAQQVAAGLPAGWHQASDVRGQVY